MPLSSSFCSLFLSNSVSFSAQLHVNQAVFSNLTNDYYYTVLKVGTPPQNVNMVLYTLSSFTTLTSSSDCKNQPDCYTPSKSGSFSHVPCNDTRCLQPDCSSSQSCLYTIDSSHNGSLSTETLTFGNTAFENIIFGSQPVIEGQLPGLLGLGRGNYSFPSQIRAQFFSYCLNKFTNKSSITFGMGINPSVSQETLFTPLLIYPDDGRHYVSLVGISVDGEQIPNFSNLLSQSEWDGSMFVHSGIGPTLFPALVYESLRDAFRNVSKNLISSTNSSSFDTCFSIKVKDYPNVRVPKVVLHFTSADVSLPQDNYFVRVEDEEDNETAKYCLAFGDTIFTDGADTYESLPLIGNLVQNGFEVLFDLKGNRVGFTPNNCA